jgi:hypothetical protein
MARIFSGDYSADMWEAINGAESKRDLRDALYLIGCRLQEFESRVSPGTMKYWYHTTYPRIFDSPFVQSLWKRIFCPRGWHLWDEHANAEQHDLFCDACEFSLYINDTMTQADPYNKGKFPK